MDYNFDYIYSEPLTDEVYGSDYGSDKTGGFDLSPLTLGLWATAIVVSAGFYFAGAKQLAIGVMGAWILLVVLFSPRAGIAIALSFQVWDVVFNPETGGGFDWISPGRVLSVIVIFSYLRYVLSTSANIKSCKYPLLFFFLLVIWGAPSVLWAFYKTRAVWSLLKILIQLALTVAGIHLLSNPKILRQTFILMIIGSATGAMYALFSGIALYSSEETRLALAGAGINAFAISIGVSIMAAIALALLKKNPIYWLLSGFCALAMMMVALRTGTRSVLVGVPLAAIFGFAIGYWRQVHKFLLWGLLISMFSFGTLYWSVNKGFVTGKLRDRLVSVFSTEAYKENSRLELWVVALKIYADNPVGTGPGNEGYAYLQSSTTEGLEAHNVFLSVLIQYNIVGFFIFTSAVFSLLILILRIKNPSWRCIAGMFWALCMFSAMKGTTHETRLFWQPIMLTMIIIEMDFRCQKLSDDLFELTSIED